MTEPDHQITPADVAANTTPRPPRQRKRTRAGKSNAPSLAAVPEPVPAPRPGPELLRDLKATIARYCVLPTESALIAVTLYAAYTHLSDSFDYAPRMVVRSAMKRSGKSRLLEVLAELVHQPLQTINATVPYIFRSLSDQDPPTLIFDEADTVFGTKAKAEANEDLRGLLNAGFRRGQTVGRTVGPMHTPQQFPTFAPAILAGIGRMPDTIEDRAVVIVMKRRKPTETVEQFRFGRDVPILHELRAELARWAETITPGIPEDLPVYDREADTWEPLIAVADAAGGHWPQLARMACKAMCSAAGDDDADQLPTMLLADIKEVFDERMHKVTFLASNVLCDELRKIDDAPWSSMELNPSRLGRRLADHRIRAGRKADGDRKRGYFRADFVDVWERHLPAGSDNA